MPDALEKAYEYHIYFWSNEGYPLELIHIHISKAPHINATKYWMLSDGALCQDSNNDNVPLNDLRRLLSYISLKRNIMSKKNKWINHFGDIKYIK